MRAIGERASQATWYGYRSVRLDGEVFAEHRLVWLWHTGDDPGDLQVDHIDRDSSNNHIDNLRLADYQDNLRNTASVGVGWHTAARKWRAYICVDHKDIHLGLYVELEDAVRARLQAEIHHFGEWAPTCYEDFDEELKARMERLKDLKRRLKSKSKGVTYDSRSKRWCSSINFEGERYWLGSYRTKTEALMARRKAEIRFGLADEIEPALASRFARINKPQNEEVKGISFTASKASPWRADIGVRGKTVYLGAFATREEAVAARCDAEVQFGLA